MTEKSSIRGWPQSISTKKPKNKSEVTKDVISIACLHRQMVGV